MGSKGIYSVGINAVLFAAGGLGKLALILAALREFDPVSRREGAQWFWGILLIEVLFGFMSGMKSAVGMPIVIAGVVLYLCTGRIPICWIGLTIAMIVVGCIQAAC